MTATLCQAPGCRDAVARWCHASCCSGETGLCEAHYRGSRHERAELYERYGGAPLPATAADCREALVWQRERILDQQHVLERNQRMLADLRRIEELLVTELATWGGVRGDK